MPKVSRRELKDTLLNPDSVEYSPSKQEIEDDGKKAEEIERRLAEIDYGPRDYSIYVEEQDERAVVDPEDIWRGLMYLEEDLRLSQIRDVKLREKLEKEILGTERKVYTQYIPFIEARINFFGRQNSPLERHNLPPQLSAEEVGSYFEGARAALNRFKIPPEERADFLFELERLQEKMSRYQNEPTLFTFEKKEKELQGEISDLEYSRLVIDFRLSQKILDSEDARKEDTLKFGLLLSKALSLKEIAARMLKESIRTSCLVRAESLFEYVNYFKVRNGLPRELLAVEAELKDLLRGGKEEEVIDRERLGQISGRLFTLRKSSLDAEGRSFFSKLEKLFRRVQKISTGETTDADDVDFQVKETDADWAWSLLGVRRNVTAEEARRAYHRLARKYHPDVNKRIDAEEKMQKINEAFDLVMRVAGR